MDAHKYQQQKQQNGKNCKNQKGEIIFNIHSGHAKGKEIGGKRPGYSGYARGGGIGSTSIK